VAGGSAKPAAAGGPGHLWLDATRLGRATLERDFPTVLGLCRARGIDPVTEPIPVAPGAHYTCGGVQADMNGRTSLPGLFAVGEVASTGVHGANRLASNSLLEGLVFAARVAADIGALGPQRRPSITAEDAGAPAPVTSTRETELRALMSRHVGVVRDGEGLADAIGAIGRIEREATAPGLRNMAIAALLVATAAWRRRESRGAHFRSDFPQPDPRQAQRVAFTLTDARAIAALAAPEPALQPD
jgi:L-aspartate oxidase